VRLVALAASVLLFALGLEVVLRLGAPWLAPALGQVGNRTYTRYGTHPGDVYFVDSVFGEQFMVPEHTTTNYWNGYFWRHATDRRGFRNPPGAATEVLLAGDSFVYGHGVEEADTFAARLRRDHGVGAYNLGRQGDCLLQEYVVLRTYLDDLRPREVVVMVFVNDFEDFLNYRTFGEIAARAESSWAYGGAAERIAREGRRVEHGLLKQPFRLRAVRLLAAVAGRVGLTALPGRLLISLPAPRASAAPPPSAPPAEWTAAESFLHPILDWERFAPLIDAHEALLADLSRRAAARGSRLSVVFLEHPQVTSRWMHLAQRRIHHQLRRRCAAHGIPYRTLLPVLQGCDACFLPGDGHLSPEGHRRVAAFLAAEVLTREARVRDPIDRYGDP
jgi:hypothetical protein